MIIVRFTFPFDGFPEMACLADVVPREGELVYLDHGTYVVDTVSHAFATEEYSSKGKTPKGDVELHGTKHTHRVSVSLRLDR